METKNNLFTLVLFLLMALASCQGNSNRSGGMDNASGSDSTGVLNGSDIASTGNGQGSPEEGDALSVLNAINQNEIDIAAMAQSKEISTPVMDYATMLHREHSENMSKTNQLAGDMNMQLNETADVRSLREKGAAELAKLKDLVGEDFENAYLDAMIKGHTEALATIDDKLVPKANADAVRQHLSDTRGHVAMHLEAAKKLRGQQ